MPLTLTSNKRLQYPPQYTIVTISYLDIQKSVNITQRTLERKHMDEHGDDVNRP